MSEQMERFKEIDEAIEEMKSEAYTAEGEAQEKADGAELLRLQGGIRALTTLQTRLTRHLLMNKEGSGS